MAQKPSIPKGTRDFSPAEMSRRNYIFNTIRQVFGMYGYRQIETPAMETLQTLMGKYGEEGDKLLFKVLNSGDFMRGVTSEELLQDSPAKLAGRICEKGLRYDLTVPFARFVVMHRNDIQFPFKRFQMQPVWRADRPQKGRYREFWQCDADVVGSDSLVNEAELLQMIDEVMARLGIRTAIKLNNRKVLAGLAEYIGEPERLIDITVAIDKIEKIGVEKVCEELAERGLSTTAIEKLTPALSISGTIEQRLCQLSELLRESETGMKGIEELRTVIAMTNAQGLRAELDLDVSLARGLNYYTGTIIEVKALDVEIGSITGGGRYDNLTGIFGMPGVSGVGISFGADRIYDVMSRLDIFPKEIDASAVVLFANFGGDELASALSALSEIRRVGIAAEIYPDAAKLKKQMKYADDLHIPYVAMIGESEAANRQVTLRDMRDGSQHTLSLDELSGVLKAY